MRFIELSFNDGGKSLVSLSSVAVVSKSSKAEGALIILTNKEWIVCDEAYDVVVARIMEAQAESQVFNRQNPMPVKDKAPLGFGFVGDCPVCGTQSSSRRNYCFGCGQKLDWEAGE